MNAHFLFFIYFLTHKKHKGFDLNRQFYATNHVIFPTVAGLKRLIAETKQQFKEKFVAFIDLHSHSIRKNVFAYGPRFPIDDIRYYIIKLIPKLMSQKSPLFRYYSCKFKNQRSKIHTGRVTI